MEIETQRRKWEIKLEEQKRKQNKEAHSIFSTIHLSFISVPVDMATCQPDVYYIFVA